MYPKKGAAYGQFVLVSNINKMKRRSKKIFSPHFYVIARKKGYTEHVFVRMNSIGYKM